MRKALVILAFVAVVALCANLSQAGPRITAQCSQDNFNMNYPGETGMNKGGSGVYRFAKAKQEGTWYADWSYDDKAALKAGMAAWAAEGGVYGVDYWVQFEIATGPYGVHGGKLFTPGISVFFADGPWAELQAANDFRAVDTSTVPPTMIRWAYNPDQTWKKFWDLTEILNSAPVVGNWDQASIPAVYCWNRAVVDQAVIDALVNDPTAMGLRAVDWLGQWYNDNAMAKGQWGGGGRGRLLLVPEPATMLLIGVGAVGLMLRRRR